MRVSCGPFSGCSLNQGSSCIGSVFGGLHVKTGLMLNSLACSPMCSSYQSHSPALGGSWVVISRVISLLIWLISIVTLLITLLIYNDPKP